MTRCACRYPEADLEEERELYGKTRDIDSVQKMLHEKFVSMLRNTLNLDEGLIEDIIRKGWGVAGIRKGNTIIATKITAIVRE